MPKRIKVIVRCPDKDPECRQRHYEDVLEAEHTIELARYNSSSPYYGEFANVALAAILDRVQELEEEVRRLKEEADGNLSQEAN
jgi:hypothetical protein